MAKKLIKKKQGKLQGLLEKFFLIDDTPHKVAAGAALGVFLGIFPGEGLLSALVLSSFFRLNRLAATAGVMATNMWTTFFLLPVAAVIGGGLFGTSPGLLIEDFKRTHHMNWEFFRAKIFFMDVVLPLGVGFLIAAGVFSLLVYYLLFLLLKSKKVKFR